MRKRQIIALFLLPAYLPACANYQPTTTPLPELTAPPKSVYAPDLEGN